MTFKHKLSSRLARLWARRAPAAAVIAVGVIFGCLRAVPTDARTLVRLVILPPLVSLAVNQSTDFYVFGITDANDSVAVAVDWSATGGTIIDSSVVNGNGMHKGHFRAGGQPGSYKVMANDPASGKSDSASVVVTSTVSSIASVVVIPANAGAAVGGTIQFVAVPLDANGTALGGRVISWSSSNTSVASVDGNGLATALAAGTASITATSEGVTGSGTLAVSTTVLPVASVTISPASASVVVGLTAQLSATLRDANGNTVTGRTITWSSTSASVATVSGTGLVTGVAVGSASVIATSEGKADTAVVTVTSAAPPPVASVTISPASASVVVGLTAQLSATLRDAGGNTLTGRTITWSSTNASVATVSGSGLVTGVAVGSGSVIATSESKADTAAVTVTSAAPPPVASVTISPASATVFVGFTSQLTATLRDANGNLLTGRTITWASSNTSVAAVNGSGVVTGVTTGSASVTATSEGKVGTAAITVTTPPPPPTGSCLTQSGPLVTLSGLQTSTYETTSLAGSTRMDATTVQFLVDQSVNVVTRVGGGDGICWSGGEILGQYVPATPWTTMHDKYGMIPGSHASANLIHIENLTVFDQGDGISFDTQPDSAWSIRNVHVKYSRDDCVENDLMNDGTVDSSFFDGCYDIMSAQEYTSAHDGSNKLITISNSLARLQEMDAIYETGSAVPRHEAIWKWSSIGPKLALYNNVFRADAPSISGQGARMYMAPPPGKLADCSNNVMVWLGPGSFPETLPTTFNGKQCFTIMTGAAGLAYWDAAVAAWHAAHPNTLPDVAPPIVGMYSPGLTGSTTLTGVVTLRATAVDDRDVVGVQFQMNGTSIGAEVTTGGVSGPGATGPTKYALSWDSHGVANGTYTLTAIARDAVGHTTTSAGVTVTVSN
ncbi:MAG: hypothetical protein DMD54_11645 [Gemmatimonadetes bacterium]|nr:MAG: hypothetical protein DMD54_11645 [Gemmatimonadota bacterium]